jgi:hypothetical protein
MDTAPTPHPSPLRDDTDARLPATAFLRYEHRADGWSAGRQAAFLAHLADHGVVADAAACVGKHVSGGYALRRQARGYAFNLGWEAALIIARRVMTDQLMTAAIRGETARWVRVDGETTYIRQNTKLSMALLDRINLATTLTEVMAVATRFDWFIELIDREASAEQLWEYFFEDALAHDDVEARGRVRASLLLCEDSGEFEADGAANEGANETDDSGIEYKSMDGPPRTGDAPNQIFTARALYAADAQAQTIWQARQSRDGAADDGNRRRDGAARTQRELPRGECLAHRLPPVARHPAPAGRDGAGAGRPDRGAGHGQMGARQAVRGRLRTSARPARARPAALDCRT